MDVKVEMMSTCPFQSVVRRVDDEVEGRRSLITNNCLDLIDLAVIKPMQISEDFNCLKISTRAPRPTERLFTVGTPGATSRGVKDANGSSLQLSDGHLVESSKCLLRMPNFLFSKTSKAQRFVEKDLPPKVLPYIRKWQMLQTNVDVVEGSSGGSLIDEDFEVTGVAALTTDPHNSQMECRGATFFAPISRLEEASKKWGGSFKPDQLKCDQRKNPQPKAKYEFPYI